MRTRMRTRTLVSIDHERLDRLKIVLLIHAGADVRSVARRIALAWDRGEPFREMMLSILQDRGKHPGYFGWRAVRSLGGKRGLELFDVWGL